MKKVYVVLGTSYSPGYMDEEDTVTVYIAGVFSSHEVAQAYVDKQPKGMFADTYEIEEKEMM
jgi:hypothetical protein